MTLSHAPRVALLYVHPILGEGIAAYLREAVDADLDVVDARDAGAVARALRAEPGIVVFEASPGLGHDELERLAPRAVLIDMSPATASGPRIPEQAGAPCIETIVRAIEHDATPHAS